MVWLFIFALMAVAAGITIAPFLRKPADRADEDMRARLFQLQIADIDREERQQIISADEAKALRIEAQRRVIASEAAPEAKERPMQKPQTAIALAAAAMVIAGAVTLYALKGRPDVASVPARAHPAVVSLEAQPTPPAQSVGSVDAMVEKLAARLEQNPDDANGWRMLGWSYFNLKRHKEAADAYARAVALAPDNAGYQAAYGEAMVMASGGFVTDEAKAIFSKTLALDPQDERARFFMGLAKDQAGDVEGAIADWIAMVNTAPADADWTADLRRRIAERAKDAGVNIEGKLAAAPVLQAKAAPAPTTADVQAAMAMPEGDRQSMIEGMVAGLAARLKENPNDPEGWVRLIRSRMVLGQTAEARDDLRAALNAFSDAPQTRAQILAEAQALGVEAD